MSENPTQSEPPLILEPEWAKLYCLSFGLIIPSSELRELFRTKISSIVESVPAEGICSDQLGDMCLKVYRQLMNELPDDFDRALLAEDCMGILVDDVLSRNPFISEPKEEGSDGTSN